MKRGAAPFLLLSVGLGLMASPLMAERNLIPSLESIPDVCPERPSEPDWMQNLPAREASKGMLIQMIYCFQSAEQVATSDDCSCATRFPSWDDAVQRYNDNYLGADENDHREAIGEFRAQYNALRPSARAICEVVGHW